MTLFSELKFPIGIHLGQKGFSPNIIAPMLNILTRVEAILEQADIDLTDDPVIAKELDRFRKAIILANFQPLELDDLDDDTEADHKSMIKDPKLLQNQIEVPDELSFLDNEDDD